MHFKLVALFCCLLTIGRVQSQVFWGLASGVGWNNNKVNVKQLTYTKKSSEAGFYLSAIISRQFKKRFSLTFEPGIIKKNYSFQRTFIYTGINTRFINTYLQLSAKASIKLGKKKFKPYLNGGCYSAYWLSMRVTGTIPDVYRVTNIDNNGSISEEVGLVKYNAKYKFDSKKDRRLEFGLALGVGGSYHFSSRQYIFVEASYSHSMSNQERENVVSAPQKINQTLIFALGNMLNFSLGKKK